MVQMIKFVGVGCCPHYLTISDDPVMKRPAFGGKRHVCATEVLVVGEFLLYSVLRYCAVN